MNSLTVLVIAAGFFLLGFIVAMWLTVNSLRSKGLFVGGRLLSAWDIRWMNHKNAESENVTHPCDDPDPRRCMCGGTCSCHRTR